MNKYPDVHLGSNCISYPAHIDKSVYSRIGTIYLDPTYFDSASLIVFEDLDIVFSLHANGYLRVYLIDGFVQNDKNETIPLIIELLNNYSFPRTNIAYISKVIGGMAICALGGIFHISPSRNGPGPAGVRFE